MRHNLQEQLNWLGRCSSWEETFGARMDLKLLSNRTPLENPPICLSITKDWEPLWRRALQGRLHGEDVPLTGASAPTINAPIEQGYALHRSARMTVGMVNTQPQDAPTRVIHETPTSCPIYPAPLAMETSTKHNNETLPDSTEPIDTTSTNKKRKTNSYRSYSTCRRMGIPKDR